MGVVSVATFPLDIPEPGAGLEITRDVGITHSPVLTNTNSHRSAAFRNVMSISDFECTKLICSIGLGEQGRRVHQFKMTRFGSLLLVPANMDIVDQTKIFTKLDPFHQQFIPTPTVNAGDTSGNTFNLQIKLISSF